MPPEDENPTTGGSEPDATVVVEVDGDGDDEPTVDAGDTTVIVAPDSGSNDGPSDFELGERLTNLERDVQELRSQLWDAEGNAAWALVVAEDAAESVEQLEQMDEEILDAVDEADAEILDAVEEGEIEKDEDGEEFLNVDPIEPASAKIHPLFRPASDWFKK